MGLWDGALPWGSGMGLCDGALPWGSAIGLCHGLQISLPAVFERQTYRPPLGSLGKALLPHVHLILDFVRLGMEPRVLCTC